MASVLIMSLDGDGVPLAIRLASEGHIVKVCIKHAEAKKSLRGYKNPSLINQPRMLDQFDLILYDMSGLGDQAENMKEAGRFVIGGGAVNDKLELDREYGEKVASKLLSVQIPKGPKVDNKAGLIKELERSTKPMVVKPLDNKLPTLTLVSGDDANRTLISIARNMGEKICPCILQERIDGVEISTEGWFDGEQFQSFNHTIEYKRLFEGDHGPQTGCMGNIVWVCGEDEIVKRALLPLQPLLQRVEYLGPIDVNLIATEKDLHFLEFTPRFGYDAIQTFTELIKGSLFDFFWNLCVKGRLPKMRDQYALGVRMSMPPYPHHEGADLLSGLQVLDIDGGARKHLFLADVMRGADQTEILAGVDGVIGCAVSRGSDITEARRRAYRTIDKSVIHPDVQFRKDIGAGVEKKIEQLKTWGWLDA